MLSVGNDTEDNKTGQGLLECKHSQINKEKDRYANFSLSTVVEVKQNPQIFYSECAVNVFFLFFYLTLPKISIV